MARHHLLAREEPSRPMVMVCAVSEAVAQEDCTQYAQQAKSARDVSRCQDGNIISPASAQVDRCQDGDGTVAASVQVSLRASRDVPKCLLNPFRFSEDTAAAS